MPRGIEKQVCQSTLRSKAALARKPEELRVIFDAV
jgi:hypothetical protein